MFAPNNNIPINSESRYFGRHSHSPSLFYQKWPNLPILRSSPIFFFLLNVLDFPFKSYKILLRWLRLLNLLHAEVSYIMEACHWTLFPLLPVLAIVWNAKTAIFFSIFRLPIFVEPYHQTYVHQSRALIIRLTHTISPYFGTVSVLFYNIKRFSMKNCSKSRNLGWKLWKFQQNRQCFQSKNWETDASHVGMWFAQLCLYVMNI